MDTRFLIDFILLNPQLNKINLHYKWNVNEYLMKFLKILNPNLDFGYPLVRQTNNPDDPNNKDWNEQEFYDVEFILKFDIKYFDILLNAIKKYEENYNNFIL